MNSRRHLRFQISRLLLHERRTEQAKQLACHPLPLISAEMSAKHLLGSADVERHSQAKSCMLRVALVAFNLSLLVNNIISKYTYVLCISLHTNLSN